MPRKKPTRTTTPKPWGTIIDGVIYRSEGQPVKDPPMPEQHGAWRCRVFKDRTRAVESEDVARYSDTEPRAVRDFAAWLLEAAAWMEAGNGK